MGIRTLKLYGRPARQAKFNERIEQTRLWLENAKPVTTYELADKLDGLQAAGVPVSELRDDAASLSQLQRPDGGWTRTP